MIYKCPFPHVFLVLIRKKNSNKDQIKQASHKQTKIIVLKFDSSRLPITIVYFRSVNSKKAKVKKPKLEIE